MIAHANWTRPIYVATTVGAENYMNLGDNFIQEGLANRITPFTTNINGKVIPGMTNFDTEKVYDNVMNRFKFGGANTPGIYLDETVMRMCFTHRRLMSQLASHLIEEGKTDKAKELIDILWQKSSQYMTYYCSLSPGKFAGAQNDCMLHLYVLNHLTDLANVMDKELGNDYYAKFNEIAKGYTARGGRFQ
jgi:hypothetical protein